MGWYYFEDLKDMQETAVDAVYDFCEDSEQQIRLLGYNALHEIVARNSYWTERNVDVLVQLLRNDEAKERQVIIDSIEKCILHDPAGTLHVVFEYATIPQQEKEDFDMDLRNAVLEIMAPSFARRTFEGLATHPTQLESVGTDIIKLVETTSPKETVALMDVLLLRLTEKFPQSTLASKLNTALVKKMAATFESETSALGPARTTALPITTSLLEVAASIARTQETNPATVLPVVGFASNTLLASKVVESIIPEDRYTIASIALGLFLGVKDRDESAIANVRIALAQRFGLLVDVSQR
ncbi:hypothetical protein DL93DRAFT_2073601 [Clavulina sp. PMI_390]|nr:hypothetical protein DL93DRAFT_2073601 [Clavulina sp. PMI_390]